MKDNFYHSCNANIDNQILDKLKDQNVISVSLSIKASHSGKVNGNYVFYTPYGMKTGLNSLTYPFKKHLQNLHRGDAVGEINNANYIDYSNNFSESFQRIAERIDNAKTPEELVTAVKDLTNHEEYNKSDYKGLGVVQVSAELYDVPLIRDLVSGTNKGKVSIGGKSDEVYCSICSSVFGKDHEHKRGKTYSGETCFAVYNSMNLDHIGFVPEPADGATETVIISDALDNNSSSVTINEFKIQDNIQGHNSTMNIEQLKEFVKNADNLVDIEGLTDIQKEGLKESYIQGKKHLRSINFLFPEDKLLPIATKETVALSLQVINKLEDGSEKKALLDLIQPHVEKFFTGEETVDSFIKSFEPLATTEEVETETKETEVETAKTDETTEQEVETKQEETLDIETLIQTVVSKTIETLQTSVTKTEEERVSIEDSVEYGMVLNRNRQLELDNESLATVNTELTNKYKQSIISQILLIKGVTDPAYKKVLENRTVEALQNTLEDVQFDSGKTESNTIESENTEVENLDTTAAINTSETEKQEVEQIVLQDSLTNIKVEENETESNVDSLSLMKTQGLAQYIKKFKNTNKG